MQALVKRNLARGGALALLVALLDQATKQWALATLFTDGRPIEVTPFFNLVAVWNRGVSFGLLASDDALTPLYLSAFALLVVAGLGIWMSRAETPLLRLSLALVIGGALGNVIDRALHGAVVDFIDLHVAGYHWPAFNLADSTIFVGVVLLLLDSFMTVPLSRPKAGAGSGPEQDRGKARRMTRQERDGTEGTR